MSCAGVAVTLCALALAALALLASAAPACSNCNVSYCTLLANTTNSLRHVKMGERYVSRRGQPLDVTLYWGSDPARAAAALLLVLLRDVHLFRRVQLAYAPHRTADLARFVPFNASGEYSSLVIGISTAWEPEAARAWWPHQGETGGLASPRLYEFGASPVSARLRLHARLAPDVAELDACRNSSWTFYCDARARLLCGFNDAFSLPLPESAVDVLGVGNCSSTLRELKDRARAARLTLRTRLVNRTILLHDMRTANHSFLFLDYDIWDKEMSGSVRVIEPPPCVPFKSDCHPELDNAIAVRIGDVQILQAYAPQLFQFVHDFKPLPETLREILEKEANGVQIEEAACQSVIDGNKYVIQKNDILKYDISNYTVLLYSCVNDPDIEFYKTIIRSPIHGFINEQTEKMGFRITYYQKNITCSDVYDMNIKLESITSVLGVYSLLGVVSLSAEGAEAASATAAAQHLPLLLADVAPDDAGSTAATWRVAGRPRHVALALNHFVHAWGWTRVAVLSQRTTLADHYAAILQKNAKLITRDFKIPLDLTKNQADEVLNELQATNARIMFVNADSKAAAQILAAAVERRMSYTDGFVWMLRDWEQNNVTCSTKHFTISLWNRGKEEFPPTSGLVHLRNELSQRKRSQLLPPRIESLVDSLLTLVDGFERVFLRYPETRQDLRSSRVTQSLSELLSEAPITGVNQLLHYKDRSIEETSVYVDEWCGDELITRLASWRVNATSGTVRDKSGQNATSTQPADMPRDDGASHCWVRHGDTFHPDCYDVACACGLLLLALVPAALMLAHRWLRRRLARLEREQKIQVIARRQHVATVLASYLVERDALELRQELGAGRFGNVRLAQLHAPPRAPRYIAAKALRDNASPAEESDFLREACTIASLDHAHIVRLVGVCIADGPPLVLMELAFFGDLLGYLRARRHLVEEPVPEVVTTSEEAAHVSAVALTRLAREAAEALQYLAARGVVHRDVRAANCLVDARRSLKLADFGMARDTVASADGAPEYACRRRGLFPVLWMAPESLAHGVFSAASDVWAFGVLMLELVTLGARPYGTMSPLRVLDYVAGGGVPLLPLDATPQTRGLTRLCWQRTAERRPSAAELAAYLAAWPCALRPAPHSQCDEPADADSGYGESPSTELLPPDSPRHSLDQLKALAATH